MQIKIKNKDHKRVVSNMVSLFILQGSNYILPLILLPYLVHVLGIEYFGLLAFATATISFFRGVVSYGFDLTGTQQISIHRDNPKKLTEIFNAILAVKFILALLSLFLLSILLLFVDKFHEHWEVFLYTFIIVFGDVLFPVWFFQGVEKMKMITYLRIAQKSFLVLLVILLVHNQDQYTWVPLIDAISSIVVGLIAIYYISKNQGIFFKLPKIEHIIFQFKNSWHIFVSNLSVFLYSTVNIFLLGLLTNNTNVGYYSVAMKIYMAIRGLFTPIIQALFPFLAKKYKESQINYYNMVNKLSKAYVVILALLAVITYCFSQELVGLISGKQIIESENILRILAISIVFAIGSFFTPLLVIKGEGKTLSKITFISMIINLIFVYPAIYFEGIYGLTLLFLLVQIIQATLQIWYNKEIYFGKTI